MIVEAARGAEFQETSTTAALRLGEFLSWDRVLPTLVQTGVVLVLSYLGYRFVRLLTNRLEREVEEEDPVLKRAREQRARTIASLLNNVAAVIIAGTAALTILGVLGIEIKPLLTAAGVAGLAISFGAQSLVKDVLNGIFILVEGQFGIGDVIRIGETAGQVEKITLRATTLRDMEGVVHTFPNGEITRVSNLTKGWSRAVLDLRIGYREDIERATAVLDAIGQEFADDPQWGAMLLETPQVLGVQSLSESAVIVRFIAKTYPLQQWAVARELRKRIKARFEREGIEIPFPHMTLFWGTAQEGAPLGDEAERAPATPARSR
jgi:small conductance mechanosensitive channel